MELVVVLVAICCSIYPLLELMSRIRRVHSSESHTMGVAKTRVDHVDNRLRIEGHFIAICQRESLTLNGSDSTRVFSSNRRNSLIFEGQLPVALFPGAEWP